MSYSTDSTDQDAVTAEDSQEGNFSVTLSVVFSERSLFAVARPSVVCLSSVTFVRPTQAVQIFCDISMALGTLAIH